MFMGPPEALRQQPLHQLQVTNSHGPSTSSTIAVSSRRAKATFSCFVGKTSKPPTKGTKAEFVGTTTKSAVTPS